MSKVRNIAAFVVVLASFNVYGQSAPFPVPPDLADEVRFWKTVFGTYDHNQILIHDAKHLEIIYQVVDLKIGGNAALKKAQEKIAASLAHLSQNPPEETLSEEEKYYQKLFKTVPEKNKYALAIERIRTQNGLRDSLKKAIAKSVSYIGDIEAIFEQHGLPKELSALIFVESMFNPLAVSEVGASGLWQFMPHTGKKYVTMNSFWDDRNDPLNATKGAAAYLKILYQQTGDFALAINSYHSGVGRVQAGMRKLKSTEIANLIHNFKNPGYGFHSRNYYPKFLAVLQLYQNRRNYLGEITEAPPLTYDIVTTAEPVKLPEIASRFAINMKDLRQLNTALKKGVLNGSLPLPPNYPLKVPKGFGYYLAAAIGHL